MKYDDEERARRAEEADADTIAILQRELEDHQEGERDDDRAAFTTLAVPFAGAATFALATMVGPVVRGARIPGLVRAGHRHRPTGQRLAPGSDARATEGAALPGYHGEVASHGLRDGHQVGQPRAGLRPAAAAPAAFLT